MSTQHKNGTCSCWRAVNETLNETGDELSQSFSINGHMWLHVATNKRNPSRAKPKTIVASFCPFCGEKLHEPANT